MSSVWAAADSSPSRTSLLEEAVAVEVEDDDLGEFREVGGEEEEEGERPVNVLARKGSRSRAHSGPCSWIEAVGAKYASSVSEGGAPAAKAERKARVVWMRGE